MAVTFSNATLTAGPVSANAKVLLHTAVANSVMLVAVHSAKSPNLSAVRVQGASMALLGSVADGTGHTELWGLTAPAAGTLTLTAMVAGNSPTNFCLVALTYTGHRAASPFGGVVQNFSTGTVTNLAVSSTLGDMVVAAWGISANTTIAISGNQTNRADTTHSTSGRMIVGDIAGASTVSASASSGASCAWAALGINLISSVSAAPSGIIARMSLLGCGS